MEGMWTRIVWGPLRQLGEQALASLSSLLGMLVLVLLGLVVGWLAKQAVYGVLRALRFDRLCDRIGVGMVVERSGLARSCSYLAGEIVRGLIVRSPTIVQGILGGLKNIIGGRIGAYTEMCEQARKQAFDAMLTHAEALGANAIVGVRYDASEVVSKGSATEVLCYGTAVVIQKS